MAEWLKHSLIYIITRHQGFNSPWMCLFWWHFGAFKTLSPDICGVHMESTWTPPGLHLDSTWTPYDSTWYFMWSLYGVHVEFIWSLSGVHVEFIWSMWSLSGVCGVHMESVKYSILGVIY